jgi:hypothetical protein
VVGADAFAPKSAAKKRLTALENSTGRGAISATRQFWSKGNFSGASLNFLNSALNQCGKSSLIC